MTPTPMSPTFRALWLACEAAYGDDVLGAMPAAARHSLWAISPGTYRFWMANSGNAKDRRRVGSAYAKKTKP